MHIKSVVILSWTRKNRNYNLIKYKSNIIFLIQIKIKNKNFLNIRYIF